MGADDTYKLKHPESKPAPFYATETVIDLCGCYDIPVIVEYAAAPAEPVNDYPGWIDVIHVKGKKSGRDLYDFLSGECPEFLAALANDIKEGL